MVEFAEAFPAEEIVVTLSRQLGWSHFVVIIPLRDDLKRDSYLEVTDCDFKMAVATDLMKVAVRKSRTYEPWQTGT